MIKRNYYSLVAGLPDIVLEEKKILFSSVEFRQMLKDIVSKVDYALVELLFLPFDHNNLLFLFYNKGNAWDERGNYQAEDLELLMDKKLFEDIDPEIYPDYIIKFAEIFHSDNSFESVLEAEQMLVNSYYDYLLKNNNLFIREYAEFKLTVFNIMTALNGRKYDLQFDVNLVGDNDIVSALKKSRARDFGLSLEVQDIEQLIQIFEVDNLLERELRLDNYDWNFLDEQTFFNYFSIEKILAFVLKLFIVERWMSLDVDKGNKLFNRLLKELESDFQFPEEFTLTYGKR